MSRAFNLLVGAFATVWFVCCMLWALTGWPGHPKPAPAPTKTETLKCVRVKEVGADAQIIYKCEVPK